MLSIDKGLLGKGQLGDVVERHRRYGELVDKLDIIVFCRPGFSENQISDKLTVFPTNSKSRLNYFFDGLGLAKNLFAKNQYDLIVTQEPFITGLVGYFFKKRFKSKLLIHFHGDFWQNPNWLKEHWLNFIFLLISKFTVPRADAIRVMSQGQKDKLVKAGINEKKIRVISTPINLEKYNHPNLEQVKNFKDHGLPIILHVSRKDYEAKDFRTLLKAFEIIYQQKKPKVHFWQVGAGLTPKELKERFPDIPLSFSGSAAFRMDPQVEPNSLINIYHSADVVVLSSKSESFGKVLVEANACGKPVVSTATTGAKEIVEDGYNGFLVPIGDAQSLAEKILFLLNNPEKAKAMGENGRKLVYEKFADNTEKIIDFWQEVIAGKL